MSISSSGDAFAELVPFGWSGRTAALLADHQTPARVVRVDRDRCIVVSPSGETTASAARLDRSVAVCTGDWVALEPSGHGAVPWNIVAIAERWSLLERADPRSDGRSVDVAQPLAANVDVVASVHPLDRALSINRIEREVALAWHAGAVPVVVLTKADRHDDPDAAAADVEHRLIGVDVVVTSALSTDAGIDEVRSRLRPDRTLMLLGPSGAGKSTLANAVLGDHVLDTGEVRTSDARGRHTTTARHLVPVPGGGVLLDTPGIRSIALLDAGDGVSAVFGDIEELATRCRFSDCAHQSEPGCAITAAIADGDLDAGRVKSWRKLQRELAAERRRADPLAAATRHAELKRWGRVMKEARGRSRP